MYDFGFWAVTSLVVVLLAFQWAVLADCLRESQKREYYGRSVVFSGTLWFIAFGAVIMFDNSYQNDILREFTVNRIQNVRTLTVITEDNNVITVPIKNKRAVFSLSGATQNGR